MIKHLTINPFNKYIGLDWTNECKLKLETEFKYCIIKVYKSKTSFIKTYMEKVYCGGILICIIENNKICHLQLA